MESELKENIIKINLIIQTYNRPKGLRKCLNSILNSNRKNIDLAIFIYDNCSEQNPQSIVDDFVRHFENINLFIHPKNIGGDPNTWFVLKDQIYRKSDFITFISDDDYILNNYFEEMIKFLNTNEEIVINHSSLVHNIKRNNFEVRSIPSRKLDLSFKNNNKFIGMIDSKVFSSFTISTILARKSYEAFKNKFSNTKNIKYRYPLCALSSFTNKYVFIEIPTYVHSFENETYWGEVNYFEDFFINRIEMFNDCYLIGAYNLKTRNSLFIDFISGQKISYFFILIFKYQKLMKPFSFTSYVKLIFRFFISKISFLIRSLGKIFIKIDNKLFKKIGPYY